MIVLTTDIDLYGRKVITDLALRTGMSTKNDFSYGLGCNYVVNKYWHDTEDTSANLEDLLEKQTDFDADVVQPCFSEEDYPENRQDGDAEDISANTARYNPRRDPINFDGYYRRLEDIAHPYLEAYIGNIIYNICYTKTGVKKFNKQHVIQPTLSYSDDDDDDFTELCDLQVEVNDDWSLETKQRASQNLPYVIKRLHNMSCYTKVHMLSYISAYIRAKNKLTRDLQTGSSRQLKANDVIREGVYLCNEFGAITKQVKVENKNKRAQNMFTWITGNDSHYQSYYMDFQNYVHYCEVLNIDIVTDDMTKYGPDFVRGLIVTIVTPNAQYNKQVFNALQQTSQSVKEEETVNPISNTITSFEQVCVTDAKFADVISKCNDTLIRTNKEYSETLLNLYYMYYLQSAMSLQKVTWVNGWLCYDGKLQVFPCNCVSKEGYYSEQFIVNELGYCVQLTADIDLFYMTTNNALDNILNKLINKDTDYKYNDWVRVIV